MSRALSGAFQTAVAAGTVWPALLVQMEFDSGNINLWTGIGNLSWDSKTWSGVGSFGGVSPIEEATSVEARGLQLGLTGVPSANISLALSEPYRGRKVKVWLALFDSAGAIITDPDQRFAGRMDQMDIQLTGQTANLTVRCENRLIDFSRPRESRYSDAEQQRLYSADVGCEYVALMPERAIYWGSVAPSAAATPSGGGPLDWRFQNRDSG